ncbi:MAG: hypothetical protein Q9218_005307 [Villophora microphyllina]
MCTTTTTELWRWLNQSKPKSPPTFAVYFQLPQRAGEDKPLAFTTGIWSLADLTVARDNLDDCSERKILDKTIQGFVDALVVEKAPKRSGGFWRKKHEDKAKQPINLARIFDQLELLSYRNEKHHRSEGLEVKKDIAKKIVKGTTGLETVMDEDDDIGCQKASMLMLFSEDKS